MTKMSSDHITLNESVFDGAFVIRDNGEPVLPLRDRREALYALEVARGWAAQGHWISATKLEQAVWARFPRPAGGTGAGTDADGRGA